MNASTTPTSTTPKIARKTTAMVHGILVSDVPIAARHYGPVCRRTTGKHCMVEVATTGRPVSASGSRGPERMLAAEIAAPEG